MLVVIRRGIQDFVKIGFQCSRTQVQTEALKIKPSLVNLTPIRTATFFKKLNAEAAWKSVTTVSNAGRKRGRGRTVNKKLIVNLNKGQVIGQGEMNVKWPGLNTAVLYGPDVVQLEKLPQDPEFKEKLVSARKLQPLRKFKTVPPLERGWTSRNICGRRIGSPESTDDVNFSNFESIVLVRKFFGTMTGNMGRKKSIYLVVAVGNYNGLLGVASGRAIDMRSAIKRAKRRALKKLMYYKFEEDNTINHDFHSEFGATSLLVYKQNKGCGLVCHRIIAKLCNLIGIKDLYAKVEKSKNELNVIKAFLIGLNSQKTYQQLADEKQLHLVEFKAQQLYYPTILASPATVTKTSTSHIPFIQHVLNGNLPLGKKKPKPYNIPQYAKYLKKIHFRRNHEKIRNNLYALEGNCQSYLVDIYPECRAATPSDHVSKTEE